MTKTNISFLGILFLYIAVVSHESCGQDGMIEWSKNYNLLQNYDAVYVESDVFTPNRNGKFTEAIWGGGFLSISSPVSGSSLKSDVENILRSNGITVSDDWNDNSVKIKVNLTYHSYSIGIRTNISYEKRTNWYWHCEIPYRVKINTSIGKMGVTIGSWYTVGSSENGASGKARRSCLDLVDGFVSEWRESRR